MSDYNKLIYNVDKWYDYINDFVEYANPDVIGDSDCNRYNKYLYCYLSCISEFSDDIE